MAKLNFQLGLLQSSVSHDPSEIISDFAAQEAFLIFIILYIILNMGE